MTVLRPESSLVFLLGAGFNIDAGSEVGSLATERYPLASDLAQICFDLEELPPEKSVEDLFQEAIDANNKVPLDRLYERIIDADFYLTRHLSPGGSREDNVYLRMLQDFPFSPILTFNYDSLLEILLRKLGHWRPEDGYGVPIQTELNSPGVLPERSWRPVLHLHGSLCIYPASFSIERRPGQRFNMLKPKEEPEFIFDPDCLGLCFAPFERVLSGHSFRYPSERVIAPVPSKAEGLRGEFVRRIHKQAVDIIRPIQTIVSIGYSFNPFDSASYSRLLEAACGARIILVAPDAQDLASRLRAEYPKIEWYPVPSPFLEWVKRGYDGI